MLDIYIYEMRSYVSNALIFMRIMHFQVLKYVFSVIKIYRRIEVLYNYTYSNILTPKKPPEFKPMISYSRSNSNACHHITSNEEYILLYDELCHSLENWSQMYA